MIPAGRQKKAGWVSVATVLRGVNLYDSMHARAWVSTGDRAQIRTIRLVSCWPHPLDGCHLDWASKLSSLAMLPIT